MSTQQNQRRVVTRSGDAPACRRTSRWTFAMALCWTTRWTLRGQGRPGVSTLRTQARNREHADAGRRSRRRGAGSETARSPWTLIVLHLMELSLRAG